MPDWMSPITHPITGQEAPAFLHGVIAPMFTPCNEDGSLDEAGIRSYTEYLIGSGSVTALFPRSGLGRMSDFTLDEAKRMIDIVTDQAAGRIPVMPGCGGTPFDPADARQQMGRYTRESVGLCQHAQRKGAVAAVLVVPETSAVRERYRRGAEGPDRPEQPPGREFGQRDPGVPSVPELYGTRERDRRYTGEDEVLSYYRAVVAETDLPVVMYVPAMAARRFRVSPQFVESVLTLPAIKGIKISTTSMTSFTDLAVLTVKSDYALIAGDEQAFLFTMMVGGTGVIGQGCSTNPEMLRAVYDRMMALDYAGATRAALDCARAVRAVRGEAVTTCLGYLARKGVNVQPHTKGEFPPAAEEDVIAYADELDALRAPYLNSITR